ncbi:unnamed protein product [Echinostoma caproni]|uniref:COesterase domain-containing protein n=1 Tax=Echinostoma caproni TaxID=27848 RepID=A0A183AIC9_9TREM|nr:unnamed protein product [Echinostoma caproni]
MIQSQQPTTSAEAEADQLSWEETVLGRSPSVSNLRVSECRRRLSSACWLNIILLAALMIAVAVILYFLIQPNIQARNYQAQTIVNTFCGTVQGFLDSDGIVSFLGIPYALPPIGQYRFKRPVELTTRELCKQAWSENGSEPVHPVTHYKPPCMQLEPLTDKLVGEEDCLYVNVFVPSSGQSSTSDTARPVIVQLSGLFFLYGGSASGLSVAAGQQPHAQTIRSVDAIHVTFNYRIGPLGFLTHPRVKQPNLGLYDQLALLRWIRNNVGAFGGDPTRVTLFGYGSGATCALALSQSLLGHSLFDRLWVTAPALGLPKLTLKEAITHSEKLFQCSSSSGASCDAGYLNDAPSVVRLWKWTNVESWLKKGLFSLPDLTSSNAKTVDEASPGFDRILVDDGNLVDTRRWYNPTYAVPTVIGQTGHEAALYLAPVTVPFWDETFYQQYLLGRLAQGDSSKTRFALTDPTCSNRSQPKQAFDVEAHLTALITDARYTCPLTQVVRLWLGQGQPIYRYYLISTHRRFDPYALSSFVSLAFHGWDGMLYLRGYLTHPDYRNSGLIASGVDEMEELVQMSHVLNKAMHEFARSGRIRQWKQSEPDWDHVNLIDQGQVCRPWKFLEQRCKVWEHLSNSDDLLHFAWPV